MTEPPSDAARAAFISYTAPDKATADTLTAWLEERGIRCWIAPRDVPAGERAFEQLEKARQVTTLDSSTTSNAIPCWRRCAAICVTRRCRVSSTCRPDGLM